MTVIGVNSVEKRFGGEVADVVRCPARIFFEPEQAQSQPL